MGSPTQGSGRPWIELYRSPSAASGPGAVSVPRCVDNIIVLEYLTVLLYHLCNKVLDRISHLPVISLIYFGTWQSKYFASYYCMVGIKEHHFIDEFGTYNYYFCSYATNI